MNEQIDEQIADEIDQEWLDALLAWRETFLEEHCVEES